MTKLNCTIFREEEIINGAISSDGNELCGL